MASVADFRAETRKWLDANCPPSMRGEDGEAYGGGKKGHFENPEQKLWLERMHSKGWTAPTWPKEYGGGELSEHEAQILEDEMLALGCRKPLVGMGLNMLGPVLLEYGTPEQKAEQLPKITSGERRWCQGYSEPGAGSDLASLQTRAVHQGDHFLVNGHKIWTSGANYADWIFCLVRTDPTAKKHEGISFLLIDMNNPGVRVKPIRLINGASPFCETFLENVQVPQENILGRLNKGWTIAKRLLEHERKGIAGRRTAKSEQPLEDIAKQHAGAAGGRIADPVLRDRIASFAIDAHAFQLTRARAAEAADSGSSPGPASAMFKYYGTELIKRRYEVTIAAEGVQGLGWEGDKFSPDELRRTSEWLRSKAGSIAGGTSEVQL
ncbi:MAG: acyl-CoA dehydrogenase family protein, partial [Acetobacteraceae bacterium]|nr:acyl-CoA dehydrogenase family protein [Acetobacteraceae bacterium]